MMNCSEMDLVQTLRKRQMIINELINLLQDDPDQPNEKPRHRRMYRFLKTSTFWEEDCAAMPDLTNLKSFTEFQK